MIEIRGIYKGFDEPVLRGVGFDVARGSIYGLIGPAGSGKSLLLRILTGLVTPDAGSALIAGEELIGQPHERLEALRARIGLLFQNNALFDFMTVGENVAFPLRRVFELPEQEVRSRAAERLAAVGLTGFEDRLPSQLSGGQRKRVGLARAAVTEAPVLFLDEPAAGLDPVTSQRIFNLIRGEQRERGSTVIVVSSDLDRLLTIVDRVGMMYRGRIIFDDTPERARTTTDPYVQQFVQGLSDGPL